MNNPIRDRRRQPIRPLHALVALTDGTIENPEGGLNVQCYPEPPT